MSERRPQGMPPTPRNPSLESVKQPADVWAEVLSTAHRVMTGKETLAWK